MGRRYYIPRTRSGSSMIASVLTQYLDNQRKLRRYELDQRLARGEITPGQRIFLQAPLIFIWAGTSLLFLLWSLLKTIFG